MRPIRATLVLMYPTPMLMIVREVVVLETPMTIISSHTQTPLRVGETLLFSFTLKQLLGPTHRGGIRVDKHVTFLI